MKFFSFIFVLFTLSFSLFAETYFSNVPPILKKEVDMLTRFPDTKTLLSSLANEGPITLQWISMGDQGFNAFWASEERTIGLNASKQWSEGEKIYSILFELHNAVSTKQFDYLDRLALLRQIDKQRYIEEVEKIEYQNGVKTSFLLKRGVQLGYFPNGCRFPIYPDFNEHLQFQKESGHSAFIGNRYEALLHS